MTHRRRGLRLAPVVAWMLAAGLSAAQAQGAAGSGVSPAVEVRLELADGAVYAGGPMNLRLTFINRAEPRVLVPASAFDAGAFVIQGPDGKPPRLARTPQPAPAGTQDLDIDGYLTTARVVDLATGFDGATRRGARWTVSWQGGGLAAGPLKVSIIRRHDPKKDRFAVVRTSLGTMTWRLTPEYAPAHVKRFVDLSRQGFYDGLTIYRIIPGVYAEGGDTRGDGTGGWENLLAGEISGSVRPATGLVGAMRQSTSMTSDSIFFISLSPADYMIGKQTFFAQVMTGLEVLAKMHRVETSGDSGLKGAHMAKKPVMIESILIR